MHEGQSDKGGLLACCYSSETKGFSRSVRGLRRLELAGTVFVRVRALVDGIWWQLVLKPVDRRQPRGTRTLIGG